jgi:hypothetical protein
VSQAHLVVALLLASSGLGLWVRWSPLDNAVPACADHFGATTSALLLFGPVGFASLVWGWVLLTRARRFDSEGASERQRARSALVRPGAVVLRGVIDDDAEGPAARITIVQKGFEERTKQGKRIRWREASRDARVRAFRLRLADGQVIRVEPGDHWALAGQLPEVDVLERLRRERRSKLQPGHACTVRGVARREAESTTTEGGYRGQAVHASWVVRGEASAPVVLSSTDADASARLSADNARFGAAMLLGLVALVHALALPYHARVLLGQRDTAEIVGLRTEVRRDSKGKSHDVHLIDLRLRGEARPVSNETSQTTCFRSLQVGDSIPVVRSGLGGSSFQVGAAPAADFLATLLSLCLWGIAAAIVFFASGRVTLWDTRQRLDE